MLNEVRKGGYPSYTRLSFLYSIVNLLEFGRTYRFLVDVEFGVDANMVAFGFELKDLKGVRLATVESKRMHEQGKSFTVKSGDRYSLKYKFTCLFSNGTYYLNFGVSSYDGKQKALNRLVDALVFKTVNHEGYSTGFFELIDSVSISARESELVVELLS